MDFSQNTILSGLGTVTFIAPSNGDYKIDGKISLPSMSAGDTAASALVVTINKNGSPVYTGLAGARGFENVILALLTTDTVTVVMSSAAAVDQPRNVIKSSISISRGA